MFKIGEIKMSELAGTAFPELAGREGLEKFVALIRGYFDQKGMHMQFNVVDRETLLREDRGCRQLYESA